MPILTDIQHGEEVVESMTSGLGNSWELVVSGEGSQSPLHQWECTFWLQHSLGLNLYALRLDDYGDPDGRVDDDEYVPSVRVVAVWLDPPLDDANAIAWKLLSAYKEVGGKYVDCVSEIGDYELDDYLD